MLTEPAETTELVPPGCITYPQFLPSCRDNGLLNNRAKLTPIEFETTEPWVYLKSIPQQEEEQEQHDE